ncbi:SRPBCC domain-containing protein [Devosia sp. XJ19-1]|uniref:SRPBCC domain-containing protein n=1 Tax=Devosia ureilytica TaxID=2952754 RepID=A0A9Q4AKV1_9HYPH|nr:SRPBCC domain-containing protein [Devosia ureilytica]MCP8882424.1 SRPBCC domain-containing protein [Devosia ureilytica]MCP8885689.1 SRPBCC domain-containing protein [Devosia ureilytica]
MSNGMDADNESQITLTRTIAAHVSDVFKAWTDPALIEQWEADEADFDAYEGGQYRFVTFAEDEDETDHEVSGEVLNFVEDERLVLSWVHKDEDDDSELIFVLDIVFKAIGDDSTSITLTERGLAHADPQTRIFSMEAWSAALEELAELME